MWKRGSSTMGLFSRFLGNIGFIKRYKEKNEKFRFKDSTQRWIFRGTKLLLLAGFWGICEVIVAKDNKKIDSKYDELKLKFIQLKDTQRVITEGNIIEELKLLSNENLSIKIVPKNTLLYVLHFKILESIVYFNNLRKADFRLHLVTMFLNEDLKEKIFKIYKKNFAQLKNGVIGNGNIILTTNKLSDFKNFEEFYFYHCLIVSFALMPDIQDKIDDICIDFILDGIQRLKKIRENYEEMKFLYEDLKEYRSKGSNFNNLIENNLFLSNKKLIMDKGKLDIQIFQVFLNNYYHAINEGVELFNQSGLNFESLNTFSFQDNVMKLGISVVLI